MIPIRYLFINLAQSFEPWWCHFWALSLVTSSGDFANKQKKDYHHQWHQFILKFNMCATETGWRGVESRVKSSRQMWTWVGAEHTHHFASFNVIKLNVWMVKREAKCPLNGAVAQSENRTNTEDTARKIKKRSDKQYALTTMWEIGQQ